MRMAGIWTALYALMARHHMATHGTRYRSNVARGLCPAADLSRLRVQYRAAMVPWRVRCRRAYAAWPCLHMLSSAACCGAAQAASPGAMCGRASGGLQAPPRTHHHRACRRRGGRRRALPRAARLALYPCYHLPAFHLHMPFYPFASALPALLSFSAPFHALCFKTKKRRRSAPTATRGALRVAAANRREGRSTLGRRHT